MDWDDEDEQTAIYDRSSGDDGARSLLEPSARPAPPPAAGRVPSIPPPSRVPAVSARPVNRPPPGPQQAALPPIVAAPPPDLARRGGHTSLYLAIGVAAVVAVALLFFLFPRSGALVITVSGPGNKPLDAVDILVNNDKKCSSSPCAIEGLKPDTYTVRAHAAGYQPMADIAVVVSSGGKAVQNLSLVRASGTGLKVLGEGSGLKLFVDGREVGLLPQEIKDMEPGDHVIRVAGNERFEPFEKHVTIEPEQMQTIGPLKLRVLKGLATISPGPHASGAKVILISGSDRRTLPRLPITLDIPTNEQHTIVATKHGYSQLKLPIQFDDGQVEKTFEVELDEGSASSGSVRTVSASSPSAPAAPRSSQPASNAESASSSGGATLNINSIPPSTVVLDGRPLGPTPKIGVKVTAGSHTVVFINGSERKISSVTVGAGQTKAVGMKF